MSSILKTAVVQIGWVTVKGKLVDDPEGTDPIVPVHESKTAPKSGIADIVSFVPSSYHPDSGEIEPP